MGTVFHQFFPVPTADGVLMEESLMDAKKILLHISFDLSFGFFVSDPDKIIFALDSMMWLKKA